jgi:hypothetical protein
LTKNNQAKYFNQGTLNETDRVYNANVMAIASGGDDEFSKGLKTLSS